MVVPRSNKLSEIVVSVRYLDAFKSALEWHHKVFGCYGCLLAGRQQHREFKLK